MKKLWNFIYILLALLAVNGIFNINYDWGGVSIIVRTYIMVLSFYVIYIFSQIDQENYQDEYREKYSWRGDFYLFFSLRIFPFLLIFLMTAAFTVVSTIDRSNWPAEPVMRLMDGRYSNTYFYALILMLLLKQNKRPGIAIPLFIFYSVAFFILDKTLYAVFEPGYGVGGIKFVKYMVFMFVLSYDFLFSGRKIYVKALSAFAAGLIIFSSITLIHFIIFKTADKTGYFYTSSARMLLKTGINYPLEEMEKIILTKHGRGRALDFINYSKRYNRDIVYTPEQWGEIIVQSNAGAANIIFDYIIDKEVVLDFGLLYSYAVSQSALNPGAFLASDHFKRYFAGYFPGHEKLFFDMYNSGNIEMKLWIIDTLEYADSYGAVKFLVNLITGTQSRIPERAYVALTGITGIDPAVELNKKIYDLEVVAAFRDDYVRKTGRPFR